MFVQNPFGFDLLRKYIITFGTLFNDIYLLRQDKNGNVTHRIKVPITYGPKEKSLTRVVQDPAINRPTAVFPLPMMSFEMTGFQYDGSRKLQTVNRSRLNNPSDPQQRLYQYNPIPYNIGFKLSIFIKNAEDGTRIVEQILPYFTPDWTVTAILIPEMDIKHDIPIVLNNVNLDDVYNGDFKDRQAMIWELDFTLKGYFYGPIKTKKTIKYSITNAYDNLPSANTIPATEIRIQPGLTANGEPTSNAELSIPVDQIVATDNFGFVVDITNPSIDNE